MAPLVGVQRGKVCVRASDVGSGSSVESSPDSIMMLGAANVELKRGGHIFMPYDALNHGGWHLVVDERCSV